MKRTRVFSDLVAESEPGLWSNCIRVGNVVYTAGLSSRNLDGVLVGGDAYEQAQAIFEKIRNLIVAAGGVIDDIVKLTIFVTDISQNKGVWRARREFFSGDFPACSLVEVTALTIPGMLVEIESVAYIGSSSSD